MNNILNIECADGGTLPYTGYIKTQIFVPGVTIDAAVGCLLLIVPDSNYISTTPVLLGTNILQVCMSDCSERHGAQFLQKAALQVPWYLAFRCLTIREKQLRRNNQALGIVRSAEMDIVTLPPNSAIVISGSIHKGIPYNDTCALLQECEQSCLPSDIDIEPTLVNYRYQENGLVDVHLCNVTTRTVTIQPSEILCEIHPVSVTEQQCDETNLKLVLGADTLLTKLVHCRGNITPDDRHELERLILSHEDVFSTGDADIGHTTAVRHRIALTDTFPFKQRNRRIPPSMFDEVRNHLQQLLDAGIIRKSHSPWASNIVLVRKKDGSLRM